MRSWPCLSSNHSSRCSTSSKYIGCSQNNCSLLNVLRVNALYPLVTTLTYRVDDNMPYSVPGHTEKTFNNKLRLQLLELLDNLPSVHFCNIFHSFFPFLAASTITSSASHSDGSTSSLFAIASFPPLHSGSNISENFVEHYKEQSMDVVRCPTQN